MEIKELLEKSRSVWGDRKMVLNQIIPVMGKVFGDICRWERNAPKDRETHTDADLQKELGNMIFSSIRWCDDLGYDPEECVRLAIAAQEKFIKE